MTDIHDRAEGHAMTNHEASAADPRQETWRDRCKHYGGCMDDGRGLCVTPDDSTYIAAREAKEADLLAQGGCHHGPSGPNPLTLCALHLPDGEMCGRWGRHDGDCEWLP